jgi:hypothetical protein
MKLLMLSVTLLLGACTSLVKCEDHNTLAGQRTYCMGKVSGDGQEGVFRDVFSDKGAEVSHFGSGPSLWGQALVGAVAAGEIAGGNVGAAALIRPPTTENINRQDQGQLQQQRQNQDQTSVNVNSNSNTNHNSLHNHNTNVISAQGGNGGGNGDGNNGHGNSH